MLKQLLYLIEKDRLPHTMLFAGKQGSGKKSAALKISEILLGSSNPQHPDLHLYSPESAAGMHSIESMRKLIEEVHMAPYQASAKVFILEEADRMLATSSNALLKTLEEPESNRYFILLSTQPDAILPTILSRARKFVFSKTKPKKFEKTEKRDILVKLLSQKTSYAEAIKLFSSFNEEEDPEIILEEILYWYRDRHFFATEKIPNALFFEVYQKEMQECPFKLFPLEQIFDEIEKMRFALRQHINIRHCLDLFRLKFIQESFI